MFAYNPLHSNFQVIAEHKTLEAELLKVRGALRMDGDQSLEGNSGGLSG